MVWDERKASTAGPTSKILPGRPCACAADSVNALVFGRLPVVVHLLRHFLALIVSHPLLAGHFTLLLAFELDDVAAGIHHLGEHDEFDLLLIGVLHPFGVSLEIEPDKMHQQSEDEPSALGRTRKNPQHTCRCHLHPSP